MEFNSLTEWTLENVDAQTYYQKKFPLWNGDFNSNLECPNAAKHKKGQDKRPSFSVNIKGTGGCFCHACDFRIGSIIHAEKSFNGMSIDDSIAAKLIYEEFVHPVMDISTLKLPATQLKSAPKIKKQILTELQIDESTLEKFRLGWNADLRRVTIPIFDQFSNLLNIRLYRLPSMRENEDFPKLLNTEGYGSPAAMFPANELFSLCRSKHRPEVVFWFTGERDTLLAWDRGLPSFCYTTGENVHRKEWIKEIQALKASVIIVADNDEAGREGAQKRLELLEDSKIEATVFQFTGDEIKDFSDFIAAGHSVPYFLELQKEKTPKPVPIPKGDEPLPEEIEFEWIPRIANPSEMEDAGEFPVAAIGRNPDLLNVPIHTKAIVSGKMDRTYSVPYLFQVGETVYRLPISREMILFVRENDVNILKQVGLWLGVKSRIEIIGHLTVTEIEIIPMIQPGIESVYVNQKCYLFTSMIECNKPYRMRIIPTTDMKTQENIGLIIEVEPVSNILDSYTFGEESYNLLKSNFTPAEDSTVVENLYSLAHEVSTRFTGILNRDDLHLVGMLSWLCPLQFNFPFEGLQRSWMNTLFLGDTETGKSRICQSLVRLFHCGVFINAESCSYVGLVGGAVKSSSGMFILRWGKIPLYNRQLVVIEELSGLTTQEISFMSEIRSAGVARYDKAGLTGETSAKTRLVCLSNVRGAGKSLGDYNTGVQAAQELIGQNEDLARFDLIVTATDYEVSGEIINKDRSKDRTDAFEPEELRAFQELAMFAWSLKPDQIDFTQEAYRSCLHHTLQMCRVYHPSLPVFKAGSGRLKLARLATAIACIQFAWDNEKKMLIVSAKHVEGAAKLMDILYSKPSFGYKRYSKVQYDLQRVIDPDLAQSKMSEVFKGKESEFLGYVSHSNGFTKFDLSEAFGTHNMFIERVISQFYLSNLLKKGEDKGTWQLSRAGRIWVEEKLSKSRNYSI